MRRAGPQQNKKGVSLGQLTHEGNSRISLQGSWPIQLARVSQPEFPCFCFSVLVVVYRFLITFVIIVNGSHRVCYLETRVKPATSSDSGMWHHSQLAIQPGSRPPIQPQPGSRSLHYTQPGFPRASCPASQPASIRGRQQPNSHSPRPW